MSLYDISFGSEVYRHIILCPAGDDAPLVRMSICQASGQLSSAFQCVLLPSYLLYSLVEASIFYYSYICLFSLLLLLVVFNETVLSTEIAWLLSQFLRPNQNTVAPFHVQLAVRRPVLPSTAQHKSCMSPLWSAGLCIILYFDITSYTTEFRSIQIQMKNILQQSLYLGYLSSSYYRGSFAVLEYVCITTGIRHRHGLLNRCLCCLSTFGFRFVSLIGG